MDTNTSLAHALRAASALLADAGVPDSTVDAELLAGFVLDTSRGGVQAAALRGDALSDDQRARLDALVARRAQREPLQHLTGTAPFRHLDLHVGPGVFVPRPETEILAQIAIDALRASATPHPVAVDLGTGSGAIALAMATEVPHAHVYAVERSPEAHAWATRNFEAQGLDAAAVRFGDLADAATDLAGTVSVIASNPPYVPDAAIPRDPEVRDYDPPAALYGGEDGLDVVRVLARVGGVLANPGGMIAIEHGEWQGPGVREILTQAGWSACSTHVDLTARDRVTTGLWHGRG